MNTQALIDRVREAYAGAAVYVDKGSVALVDEDGNVRPGGGWSAVFRTAFERSRTFEFEFRDSERSVGPHVIRAKHGQAAQNIFMGERQRDTTLELAIAGTNHEV